MKPTGIKSPNDWPSGTISLREPRLATGTNFTRQFRPPVVGAISAKPKGIGPFKPLRAALVPLSSLLRPRAFKL
jgi:hypothetical protein